MGLRFCEGEWASFLPLSRAWTPPESTAYAPMSSLAEVAILHFPSSQCPAWSPKAKEHPLPASCRLGWTQVLFPCLCSGRPGPCQGLEHEGKEWCLLLCPACPSWESRTWTCLSLAEFMCRGLCQGAWQQGVGACHPAVDLSQDNYSRAPTPHPHRKSILFFRKIMVNLGVSCLQCSSEDLVEHAHVRSVRRILGGY